MDRINLKAVADIFIIILLCGHQITASDIGLNVVTNTTSDVEEFLRENVSEFISARKKFMYSVPETKYIASDVLDLLGKSFSGYTFSTNDNYLHMRDSLYIGSGQQILSIGKMEYISQIQYYFHNREKPVSAIRLRLISYPNKETLCTTITYTGNPDSDFLHQGEPNSTINAFRDIIAMEEKIITKPANVFNVPANNGEIPIKQAHCCLMRVIFAAVACCTCGSAAAH